MRLIASIALLGLGFGPAFPLAGCAAPNTPWLRASSDTSVDPASCAPSLYPGFDGFQRTISTRSPEAQRWFNQGLQLLYGFNHDEAIRSFAKAGDLDPTCAMACWGEAYARGIHINNPVMGEEQSRLAFDAVRRAESRIAHATDVERALIRALAARYAWPAPAERTPLDEAYAEAMGEVYKTFPNDADVAALYAESLMNLQPWDLWTHDGQPKGRALEVVAVLEHALHLNERHPGANHFYIHAVEASLTPERALPAANRLRDLVPGSGHLVHMPSHIDIRIGKYAQAVEANQKAIEADERYFAKAPPPEFYRIYFLHNAHFLAYAAMMEGRRGLALDAARRIERSVPDEFLRAFAPAADGFTTTTLHVMIRFGMWKEILAEPDAPDYRLLSRAEQHFGRAVAHANLGDVTSARHEIELLDDVAAQFTDEWTMGNNSARDIVATAREMALGEIAYFDGRREEAFAHLRRAVSMEEAMRYDEPPGWMQPVRHALGALLLAQGRGAEAEEVYQEDLRRHPENAWSLLGLQQSRIAQGKELDRSLDARVTAAWARADVKPVASCYCHPDARSVAKRLVPRPAG
jgi:tetratricopeptide (TPR) repeat protein